MKNQVINSILENKIVVIVRGVEKEKLIPLAEAMYEGGIRLLEVTFDQKSAAERMRTCETIRLLNREEQVIVYTGEALCLKLK